MKWTGLNELREKYLSFFESKGHLRLPSFSLIPQNDKSLLLINSGMAPMKKYFTGEETPPRNRVTTCQKCIRTGDIDNIGKTARHGTYFEMLGNFSFGDYFKDEAIPWAWEFLTETLEIPAELLWPSIYFEDEEAYHIWHDVIGVPAERIVRLGKEDNFWEHGTGPCGPCSEIYFDRGEKYGCGKPDCKPGCDCDRYMEIWNNVFSQFNNEGDGTYTELKQKNIDTGMGLERLACVMQGVDNLFEVDTVQNIMGKISEIAGVTYKQDAKADVSLRVITDHIRSATFMLADGVSPSNEGRGYVLRRLLRRAARHGRLLGVNEPFLFKVIDTVVKENEFGYPELKEKASYLKKIVKNEEEAFNKTIGKGMDLLKELVDELIEKGEKSLSGADAFKLYDTYGFPVDLTQDIVAEKGLDVDLPAFESYMAEQKKRSRDNYLSKGGSSWDSDSIELPKIETKFVGYEVLSCDSKVEILLCDGAQAELATEGNEVFLILDQTPFYTESGGQVSDTGILKGANGVVRISSMKKLAGGQTLHGGFVKEGTIEAGETVFAAIDVERRKSIMRNHTTAHLLQAALREVLGDHVHQAGQLVEDSVCRFDFTHFEALTADQIAVIEQKINAKIMECVPVLNYESDIKTAREKGAMALFSEKYGEIVRVVEVPGFSTELCGGTHVKNTGEIGMFKIVSESSVAAGVRRIEAVTGVGTMLAIERANNTIAEAAALLKSTPVELLKRCESIMAELKAKEREIAELNGKLAAGRIDEIRANGVKVGDVSVYAANIGSVAVDTLRMMGDKLRDLDPNCCALLCGGDGKPSFLCVAGPEAVKKGVHAGQIIKAVCQKTGGKGGGRPDSAMGGIGDAALIDEAISMLEALVTEQLSK